MLDSLDTICKDCFRCVQNCPNRLIEKGINPSYKALGDEYWTPEIISCLWFQAETGRIPVSGGGYGGPFSGSGFDAMWTDMSEIVRPTRDGIHGREYISTTVDLGRKVKALEFEAGNGRLTSSIPPLVEVPLPVIFDVLPFSPPGPLITRVILGAARQVKTLAVVRASAWDTDYEPYLNETLLYVDEEIDRLDALLGALRLVEIDDSPDVLSRQAAFKARNPRLVVAIRLPLDGNSAARTADLTNGGAEVIHLVADTHGLDGHVQPMFIKDRMRQIHLHLVNEGIRDLVTLIGGGGVAMAEHMAKLVICGADLVSCDIPLLVAMECRVCKRCAQGILCPVEIDTVNPGWGVARIGNLIAGWHNQLIEVLGAMGIREVRRLRGEMGRAMFYEDLEKEFATLGKRS
jgi:ferredoxin